MVNRTEGLWVVRLVEWGRERYGRRPPFLVAFLV